MVAEVAAAWTVGTGYVAFHTHNCSLYQLLGVAAVGGAPMEEGLALVAAAAEGRVYSASGRNTHLR